MYLRLSGDILVTEDHSNNYVLSVSLSGSSTQIAPGSIPTGIAEHGGWIYFGDFYDNVIYRIPSAGGGSREVFATGLSNPRNIQIAGDWIYVANAAANNIVKIPLTGGSSIVVASGFSKLRSSLEPPGHTHDNG
jgi:hypothetical protein